MSVVSDRHNVVPFVAGKSQAFTGQRLAKVGYKTTAKQKAKFPSICVSVPEIVDAEIVENVTALVPYIRTMLADTQDKIIRGLYEGKAGNLSSVGDDDISIAACIGFLEMESTGGRLTKEAVQEWFDSELQDYLMVTIAGKMGFNDAELTEAQTVQVNKYLAGYREVIASLSGGKTFLQPAQIAGVRKAISLVDPEDEMVKRLNARLDSMEKKPELAELLDI